MIAQLLVICCLRIFVLGEKCGRRNLALHKPTNQSSTHASSFVAYSSRAVDGILDVRYYGCLSCAHTSVDDSAWWMVDLEQDFNIHEVVLVSRDKYAHHLTDFTIEVSRSLLADGSLAEPEICAIIPWSQSLGTTVSYVCQGDEILGRYVRVTQNVREALTLCEVEVYEKEKGPVDSCSDTFSLHRKNVSPNDTPLYSTTTAKPILCGSLCLTTELCTSFTVKHKGTNGWQCRLYECKSRSFQTAPGSLYYVQTFLNNIV